MLCMFVVFTFYSLWKFIFNILNSNKTGVSKLHKYYMFTFSAASLINCFAWSVQIAGTVNTQSTSDLSNNPLILNWMTLCISSTKNLMAIVNISKAGRVFPVSSSNKKLRSIFWKYKYEQNIAILTYYKCSLTATNYKRWPFTFEMRMSTAYLF